MEKNIFKLVEEKLKINEKYLSEDGKLLKAIVYSDVMNMDKTLLSLLLSEKNIKNTFFEEVEGTLVFDKQKFAWFLDSKEFLPDSYTKYMNKIGLTHNGNFISKSNDIVLDFPYKDCILEGGQDKEDQKRKEIFYNEVIASDEINRMLAPKVFANAKRYTKDRVEENITFNEDDNLIIKGNNLIVLSSLLKRYEGKVKCIYIDPPYNTGNDSFNYNDSFNHSTWLTFMKNRLEVAKKLLSDDGVILVQIDNSPSSLRESPEYGYLLVLMDEIFTRKNYVTTFTWKKKGNASNTKDGVGTITESILMYAKDFESITPNLQEFKRKYKYTDENGLEYNLENPVKTNEGTYKRETMVFPIITAEGTFYPPEGKRWTIGNNILDENGKIKPDVKYEIKDGIFYLKKYSQDYKLGEAKLYANLLLEHGSLKVAKDEIENLGFNREDFDSPKPEKLIQALLEINTNESDIVLDYHLGSGTTAAVAHKMGRRYIGIEQMDYIEDITVERMKKVIEGEQGGISKAVNWQGGGSFVYCELMENANSLIQKIQLSTEDNIIDIKDQIYSDERIVPYITSEELNSVDVEFNNLILEEKKQALIKLIDKNKLYVNYSDMDDESYDINESDKVFTQSFYKEV